MIAVCQWQCIRLLVYSVIYSTHTPGTLLGTSEHKLTQVAI